MKFLNSPHRFSLFNPIEGKIKNALTPSPSTRGRGDVPLEKGEQKDVYFSHKSFSTPTANRLSEDILQGHSTKSLSPLDAEITLYEEIHISGNISDNITVATDHHLVIDDDTVFLPNTSSLTIEPGAVIRINPGVDLTIHGILTAQGEENNMFWITSNDGFENSQLNTRNLTLSNRDIDLYNSMELSPYAGVTDDLIEWGKWDWGNTCLLNKVNNLHLQNGICRDAIAGFSNSDVDSTFFNYVLCKKITGENSGGIYYLEINDGSIERSILLDCYNGVKIKDGFEGFVKNNYFSGNNYGTLMYHFIGMVEYNEFNSNDVDIAFTANNEYEIKGVKIKHNNLFSETGISQFYDQRYTVYSSVLINDNNFYNDDWFIHCDTYIHILLDEINAENNFFNYLNSYTEIKNHIYDIEDDQYLPLVVIDDWETIIIMNTGIQ